jgi:starch synthase
MRALFVASECYPFAKTGGLGDVARALPLALNGLGVDTTVLMPAYPSALAQLENPAIVTALPEMLGVKSGRIVAGTVPGSRLPIWLVDAPELFLRDGGPYQEGPRRDWPDNARRFAYLNHAAARIASGRLTNWVPDVVHANDWHAGLLPLLLSLTGAPHPPTVFTIHNMAFQGNFPATALADMGVPERCLTPQSLEFFGQASFLKAGIRHSDYLTTVSPTYAKEVLTPEFGCGMDGLLREKAQTFSGILNGAEYGMWEPAIDPYLPRNYCAQSIAGKRTCKAEFQREMGLPVEHDIPLIGFISRLTSQKMADVVLDLLPWLAEAGVQFALVAQGDDTLESAFSDMARAYPDNISVHIGYEEPLAHRLQAGADILLAPSRFEPCGLTQLYALRYGTLPVVRRTGGLADTVINTARRTLAARSANGFSFKDPTLEDLRESIRHALRVFREPLTWRRLQMHAMEQDFSWDASANKYLSIYRTLTGNPVDERPSEALAEEARIRQAVS